MLPFPSKGCVLQSNDSTSHGCAIACRYSWRGESRSSVMRLRMTPSRQALHRSLPHAIFMMRRKTFEAAHAETHAGVLNVGQTVEPPFAPTNSRWLLHRSTRKAARPGSRSQMRRRTSPGKRCLWQRGSQAPARAQAAARRAGREQVDLQRLPRHRHCLQRAACWQVSLAMLHKQAPKTCPIVPTALAAHTTWGTDTVNSAISRDSWETRNDCLHFSQAIAADITGVCLWPGIKPTSAPSGIPKPPPLPKPSDLRTGPAAQKDEADVVAPGASYGGSKEAAPAAPSTFLPSADELLALRAGVQCIQSILLTK